MPTKADVEKRMKMMKSQQAMGAYFDRLRKAAKIEAPGFPDLVPEQKAAPAAEKATCKDASCKDTACKEGKADAKAECKKDSCKGCDVKETCKDSKCKDSKCAAPAKK